ncbi:MAG: efflux RND transporter permease subunit [Candidatus Krumholzibacteriia bacterium]
MTRFIGWCLDNRLVVMLALLLLAGWGVLVAPFDWNLGDLPRQPVPVDAIPDLGENQQIVFTEWPGRSPRDVEDQITYPLTSALLGVPMVRTVRSYSFFGFSSVYVIFAEGTDFHDSRSRILEKLASLPAGTLPPQVQPALGPDATALGQVFMYTLEGRTPDGRPVGGWDPQELRSIQDFQVRDALLAAEGIAEVASVGGHVAEYQVEADPDALRLYGLGLDDVVRAVRQGNREVGARTIEVNRVEYVVRGTGFYRSLDDIARSVITVRDQVPVTVGDVAHLTRGPALRRGSLDVGGAEATGGIVVVRYGENPLAAIKRVKEHVALIAPSLPERVLPDGTVSKVTIVPFYDRSGLIQETLATLGEALTLEILITVLVIVLMLRSLGGSLLVSGLLPVAVLLCFVAMKIAGVDANIVALSGIAIAIGTMVDMGVILIENVQRRLAEAAATDERRVVIRDAAGEVAPAIITALLTTVLSFLPVFAMTGAEGKLFRPLAFTKSFALVAALVLAVVALPPLAQWVLGRRVPRRLARLGNPPATLPAWLRGRALSWLVALVAVGVLAQRWRPLGLERHYLLNAVFVFVVVVGLLAIFAAFQHLYPRLLAVFLARKRTFLAVPLLVALGGATIWLGFDRVFAFLPGAGRGGGDGSAWSRVWTGPRHAFPGLGKEFMPPLDEGSFLYMPTTMAHASLGEALDVLSKLDQAILTVPEVAQVVGKLGRADSALDPAPISMIETVINYLPEYGRDADGKRIRQWRDHVRTPDDIWNEIVSAAKLTGTTSAPKLQPISTRLVMLQSGMRAPMGVKVKGPTLEAIDRAALAIEAALKDLPSINPATVVADRVVGKPYLELVPDRDRLARYGLTVSQVQDALQTAIGGTEATVTVEGRERYPVRVQYPRERRDSIEDLTAVEVRTAAGQSVPLGEVADVRYVRGPQAIKSEDTFLVGYVIFDKVDGMAEVDVVEQARDYLDGLRRDGKLDVPVGVTWQFAGSFENQVRSERTLRVVLPVVLLLIVLVLHLQFKSLAVTMMVFAGIFVAWSGGFWLVWLYGQPWFLDLHLGGVDLRQLFNVGTVNLSVAVWVGFIALFGIATDDGVLMATYLEQSFRAHRPLDRQSIRRSVIAGATRRVRPALMTSATTILALLPVFTLTGRGADIMMPMAIPAFGGMTMALLTLFIVPVLYCWRLERAIGREPRDEPDQPNCCEVSK